MRDNFPQSCDLQKSDNTGIFLNDTELVRGCLKSTLGSFDYGF